MKGSLALRRWQFALFILVPIINFGVNYIYPSPFENSPMVYIQPAGWAFGIWGIIFLGMIGYSYYQMQPQRIESEYLRKATWAGISAGLASIAFVPIPFTGMQWLSWINIVWHLISLLSLFVYLKKQLKLERDSNAEQWYIPTQLYLGWICAATAVSTALFLKELGVDPGVEMEQYIAAVLAIILTLVALYMVTQNGPWVALTIAWALAGLYAEHGDVQAIKYVTMLSGPVIIGFIIRHWALRYK